VTQLQHEESLRDSEKGIYFFFISDKIGRVQGGMAIDSSSFQIVSIGFLMLINHTLNKRSKVVR
jgi:hypothetical protein